VLAPTQAAAPHYTAPRTPRIHPTHRSPPPVVLMAHGLGAQKDMGLHPYAEQFAQVRAVSVVSHPRVVWRGCSWNADIHGTRDVLR
jgi:hypothetical protein